MERRQLPQRGLDRTPENMQMFALSVFLDAGCVSRLCFHGMDACDGHKREKSGNGVRSFQALFYGGIQKQVPVRSLEYEKSPETEAFTTLLSQ